VPWPFIWRNLTQSAATWLGHRQPFAIVDFLNNCLAFQALPSDWCVDRGERGTKDNDYDDFHHRRTEQHHAAATATPFDSFSSQQELAELAKAWPTERLLAIWNSLPGVTPAKKFKNGNIAATRIWEGIQGLGEAVRREPEATKPVAAPAKPKATQKAKAGAKSAKGAPAKGKATKKATPTKSAPKAKKTAKTEEVAGPREGSKTAQVVAMLQRKNGATISEIMKTMSWQRHTVRGFMAGAMKKAGYQVESFKPEGGERSYRINKSIQRVPLSWPARHRRGGLSCVWVRSTMGAGSQGRVPADPGDRRELK
jgi:hypothetical protein